MKDNEQLLRTKLYEKVTKEYEEFKKIKLECDKETIFENAYRISIFSDFCILCDKETKILSIDEIKALLKEENPVSTLCNFYYKTDEGCIDDLYEAVWYRLNDLVDENNKNSKEKNQKER